MAAGRRRWLLGSIAVVVVAVVAGITTVVAAGGRPRHGPTVLGTAPPPADDAPQLSGPSAVFFDATLRTLDGVMTDLADLRGRPVVVNFWASWCAPCRKEFPELRRAVKAHRHTGLVVVGISYRDITSDSRDFAGRMHANWTLLRDPGGTLARAFSVAQIPQTFFIGRDGQIHGQLYGTLRRDDLESGIATIEATTAATPPR